MKTKLILVEDDQDLGMVLKQYLEFSDFEVIWFDHPQKFLDDLAVLETSKLLILDVMMPQIDGFSLANQLKDQLNIPYLFLTAKGQSFDRVLGLKIGADDYITKPFHFDELLSRIKALTRRNQFRQNETISNVLTFGALEIDLNQYKVSINQEEIELSPREFKLLNYLIENIDKTVTRIQILNAVWGITFDNHTNVVDVYISYLRNKIEKNNSKYIYTVKGVGYMFKA